METEKTPSPGPLPAGGEGEACGRGDFGHDGRSEEERGPTSPPNPLSDFGEGGRPTAGVLTDSNDELVRRFLGLGTAAERDEMLAGLSAEELLVLGVSLYNAGHYFEAHEAWEAVWLDAARELRAFYQGLIQVTAAFVHVTRGEYPGSVRLLAEGIDKLRRYPPWFMGVGIGELVVGAERARERLVALGERRVREFEMGLVPRIQVRDRPEGDG